MLSFFGARWSFPNRSRIAVIKPSEDDPTSSSNGPRHDNNNANTNNNNQHSKEQNTPSKPTSSPSFTISQNCLQSKSCKPNLPLTYQYLPFALNNSNENNNPYINNNNSPLIPIDDLTSTQHADLKFEITPILHPNEVLLQRFPNKLSMKCASELRLAVSPPPSKTGEEEPNRVVPHILPSGYIGYKPSNISQNDNATILNQNNVNNDNNGCLPGNKVTRETDHEYLTRSRVKGTVYVTSERLLFVPNPKKYKPTSPDAPPIHELEFEVFISSIDTMKVVESDQGTWFFVCYDGPYITTLQFRTEIRAQHFLKLVANIRFEQMVRQSLPPKYVTPTKNACCSRGQRPVCATCAALDLADWNAEDEKLPTYGESEEALRQYLIKLKLMSKDSPFDRQSRTLNIFGMLSLACSPPSLDEPLHSYNRENHLPRRPSVASTRDRSRASTSSNNSTDERLYGIPFAFF